MRVARIRTSFAAAVMAVGLLGAAWGCHAYAATFGSPKDIREITDIEMKAPGLTDIDQLMQYYAPEAVVADWSIPGWYEGRDAIAAAYAPQLAGVKTVKFRMNEINIASDGKFACAAMQIHFNATMNDKARFAMTVRQIDAFKKIGGRWLIMQEHVSVPVDQKSGIGVINGHLHAQGRLNWTTTPVIGSAEDPAAAKKEIRRWLETSAAPSGLDDMMHYYGPGDDIILYDVFMPGEHRGQKDIRAAYAPVMAKTQGYEVKIPAFFVDSDGAFGVQIDKQDLKLTMKDGTTQIMSFRQSDCLRRIGGKWYSFFEMGSFPVDAKSGKAIMSNPAAFQ